jgi:hypothetical protein
MRFSLSLATWTQIGLWITGVYLVGLVVLALTRRRRGVEPPTTWWETIVGLGAFALATYLRFGHVETLHGGYLTMEEAAMTRTHTSGLVHFEPVMNGATYFTFAWLLDAWYGIFGISKFSPRYFTAALSYIGVICFFFFMRGTTGTRAATWGTIFLALATYAVYFSVFALETVGVMLFAPLNALLLLRWLQRPSVLRAAVFGISLALSLFTYPGLVVGYAAIVGGWVLFWLWEAVRTRALPAACAPMRTTEWPSWIGMAVGFGVVFGPVVALHVTVYGAGLPLMRGGGALIMTGDAFREAMPALLQDTFVGTHTWNLLFRGTPFVDWTYWPFAMLGVAALWMRPPCWLHRGLALSPVLVVLAVPFLGFYPGMRRGLYVLFPLCAFGGVGAAYVAARAGRLVATLLVLVALAPPVYYQLTFGSRQWRSTGFGQDWGTAPIPDDVLLSLLERYDIVMSSKEFAHLLDQKRHVALAKLAVRHGAVRGDAHSLQLVSEEDAGSVLALAQRRDVVFLTWQPERIMRAVGPKGICFALADIGTREPGRPAALHFVRQEDATRDDACLWSSLVEPATCVRLGYRYELSRLVHGLVCESAACDHYRPTFVFVQPGSVSFRVRRPPEQAPDGEVDLVLRVLNARDERRVNHVFVNEYMLGAVDRTHATSEKTLRIRVPPQATMGTGDVWSIRLGTGGDSNKAGWDVHWAKLVPATATDALANAECPEKSCVTDEFGEICDDGASLPRRTGGAGS